MIRWLLLLFSVSLPTLPPWGPPTVHPDDDFSGRALDSKWEVLNSQLVDIEVSGGELHLTPTVGGPANIWFEDGEGPLVHQDVTGDFDIQTRVRATSSSDEAVPPPISYRLAGLLVRDPASATGTRNSVHVAVGSGVSGTPVAVEDKTTTASTSDFLLYPTPTHEVELRLTRVGDTIGCYWRPVGVSAWTLLRNHDHPEFPDTVQVGLMVYSFPSTPDVQLHVDWIRF